jgi:hypothetical protein
MHFILEKNRSDSKAARNAAELDESEKYLGARSLAATPEQYWRFNLAAFRFYNSFPCSTKHGSHIK